MLEGLRLAAESELKDRLSEWLKVAYADVLTVVDPTDEETRIRDAFRTYNPVGQQPRMLSLFLGLAAAAGMAGDKSAPSQRRPRQAFAPIRKPPREVENGSSASVKAVKSCCGGWQWWPTPASASSCWPVEQLTSGRLFCGTQARRDKFIETFEAVIDFCYGVEDDPASEAKSADA